MRKVPRLLYRVWQAELVPEGTPFLLTVSSVREPSLREGIRLGQRLVRLVKVVLVTRNRNQARELSKGAEA